MGRFGMLGVVGDGYMLDGRENVSWPCEAAEPQTMSQMCCLELHSHCPSPPPAVCTTLSFSGSTAFTRLARKFDVVVIDEAAQVGFRSLCCGAALVLGRQTCAKHLAQQV